MRPLLPLLALLLAGCAAASPPPEGQASPGEPVPPGAQEPSLLADVPPWAAAPLAADVVPEIHLREWRRAENRATCAPLAPLGVPGQAEATPRAATFSGGWGVAYDLPELRSAFGVAGTGSQAADPAYDDWPHQREWADGSTAGYGPEGGTGPNQLAYLRIPGEGCLYNVWSRLGIQHLETVLEGLRRIALPREPGE
jgi:hypothetical protein